MSTKPAPKVWSRYCLEYFSVENDAAMMELLGNLAAYGSHQAALLPTGDREVLFLSRNREELQKHYRFVLPSGDVLERLANKRSQYQCAESAGIPIPRTYYPTTPADVEQIAATIRFPCVIKPAYSHIWRDRRKDIGLRRWLKAAEVSTPEELRSAYKQMSQSRVELIVQERIDGPESRLYSFYAYLNRNSNPLALCVIQKLRQWPVEYGTGCYSVTCRRDEVVALGLNLLKKIGYVGMANLEFKQDLRDGTFKLIEVNVRLGERIALASAAGVDMPHIAYRDIVGAAPDPVGEYQSGVTWVNVINDTAAFLYSYRTQMSWWRWARSLLSAKSHAYFSWSDPLPFVEHVFQTASQSAPILCERLKSCKGGLLRPRYLSSIWRE
ncbi:MAG TPA: ATP-grasp domain-containing protein [Candidatus Eisenbacteria bacterium]|nr:ATP-grasp domain-containing protein [Candidatus Eisenbacteria bacterium]